MSYCLNPGCQKPLNPYGTNFCQSCGTKLIPSLRNRYRIICPLGSGGFGRTFLAEDEDKLNEPCVVKQHSTTSSRNQRPSEGEGRCLRKRRGVCNSWGSIRRFLPCMPILSKITICIWYSSLPLGKPLGRSWNKVPKPRKRFGNC